MSVFLKRQQVRKRREVKKLMRRLERFMMISVIVLFGLVFFYGLYRVVFFSPYFSIREIVVEGETKRLTTDQLARLTGVEVGDNLFWIDVSAIYQRLKADPWIRIASVRRRPPHTLWMYIEEEEPIAILSSQGLFLMNRKGEPFKKVETVDDKSYPVFTGMMQHEKQRITQAFSILAWFDRSSLFPGEEVAEVNFHPVKGYSFTMTMRPVFVLLGHYDLEKRMEQLDRFRDAIYQQGRRIQYIVMHDQHRIVVKYST